MTAKELRAKFEADLKQLQDTCKHKEISDWMEYHWAPGHCSGKVKICKKCEKTIESTVPKAEDYIIKD